jgi:hypothetical protein
MATETGTTRPVKPEYLRIETPAPGGQVPEASGPRPVVRSIEEQPVATPVGSDALVNAAAQVYRAINAKIAWHEAELGKLRKALEPFATMARQNDAELPTSLQDAIATLLQHADTLKGETK